MEIANPFPASFIPHSMKPVAAIDASLDRDVLDRPTRLAAFLSNLLIIQGDQLVWVELERGFATPKRQTLDKKILQLYSFPERNFFVAVGRATYQVFAGDGASLGTYPLPIDFGVPQPGTQILSVNESSLLTQPLLCKWVLQDRRLSQLTLEATYRVKTPNYEWYLLSLPEGKKGAFAVNGSHAKWYPEKRDGKCDGKPHGTLGEEEKILETYDGYPIQGFDFAQETQRLLVASHNSITSFECFNARWRVVKRATLQLDRYIARIGVWGSFVWTFPSKDQKILLYRQADL